MDPRGRRSAFALAVAILLSAPAPSQAAYPDGDVFISDSPVGRAGGRLVVSLRSEPKTLNPVTSTDVSSREVIAQLNSDLIHVNRSSQRIEPGLAKAWQISRDGLQYRLELRRGLRFSDGQPLDADDVIFSFKVYLDETVHSPQRDSLVVAGKPITVKKLDPHTLVFELSKPYAPTERLFDSVAILPRHLLEAAYKEGKLSQAWSLNTPAQVIAGTGPFRLKEYLPGQRITLERNPYYWKIDKAGNRLPYLNELTFLFVANADAEAIRFQAGDTDIINRLSSEDYSVLQRDEQSGSFHLQDVGSSLEFNFLFFNLNSSLPAQLARKQLWFRDARFRQAISLATDREAMIRVVYRGLGTPLWTPVTPANKLWIDKSIPQPARSVENAKKLLTAAGFSWNADGALLDKTSSSVEFTIITSVSNAQRVKMATMLQADLKDLGIQVQVVPLDFHSVLDRIFQTHDYEAAVLGLGAGDVDPSAQMNVWMSSGNDHVWDLGESHPATTWEAEIDQLMEKQLSATKFEERKALYDRVQAILAEESPIICLATPDILVGARTYVENFRPAALDPHTLWNSPELFLSTQRSH
ncbi:MAG TPA: ABC transporter substrate-binding protein [Candidatus Aquilonibacter sp.]|nr:ABC transporter substrate-binding protein [Candidatus Aquilonibacter sp.]